MLPVLSIEQMFVSSDGVARYQTIITWIFSILSINRYHQRLRAQDIRMAP